MLIPPADGGRELSSLVKGKRKVPTPSSILMPRRL
jgi:hypothetical protein